MTPIEYDQKYRKLSEILEKLTVDDLRELAMMLNLTKYHLPDAVYDPSGKERFINDIHVRLREFRNASDAYQRARDAATELKRLL